MITAKRHPLFSDTTDPARVTYHIHTWSQNGPHYAELATPEPLAIPAEIKAVTFSEFVTVLLLAEEDYRIEVALTWS
jgi:hypothetical protein